MEIFINQIFFRVAVCGLLLAVCSLTCLAGGWTRQRTSTLGWLHSIYFVDRQHGWAAGSRGTLLSTVDGGRTWQTKLPPTEDTIREVYFSDLENGLLICESNIYGLKSNDEARAYLLRTTDGGESWKRFNLRGANVDARIVKAMFRGNHGLAFGEAGALFLTRDAGNSWTRLQTPTRYLLMGGTLIDEHNGWLVGAGSTLLQTTDGGETWNHARFPSATRLRINSISFVNARLGWAVGSQGAIYRTINGGRSWQQQRSGITTDLLDVKFLDAVEGWAVGAEGTVLHTRDGGYHWQQEPSGTSHGLERVFFTGRNHGWAVGFGGTIITYGAAAAPPRLR